jgi:hypothetical protein
MTPGGYWMNFSVTRGLGAAVATVAIAATIAGCGSAASTSAPTKAPATATPAAATATAKVASSASAVAKGNNEDYNFLVAAADLEIKTHITPTFEEITTDLDAFFSDNPTLSDEMNQTAVDKELVKFAGTDKVVALASGKAIFGVLWDAVKKLGLDGDVILADIFACGKANIPGWQAAMDAEYNK